MTNQQIKWASQHDWFRSSKVIDNITVCEVYCSSLDNVITIDSFRYLREWAGY